MTPLRRAISATDAPGCCDSITRDRFCSMDRCCRGEILRPRVSIATTCAVTVFVSICASRGHVHSCAAYVTDRCSTLPNLERRPDRTRTLTGGITILAHLQKSALDHHQPELLLARTGTAHTGAADLTRPKPERRSLAAENLAAGKAGSCPRQFGRPHWRLPRSERGGRFHLESAVRAAGRAEARRKWVGLKYANLEGFGRAGRLKVLSAPTSSAPPRPEGSIAVACCVARARPTPCY